jgi:hypothetical protein
MYSLYSKVYFLNKYTVVRLKFRSQPDCKYRVHRKEFIQYKPKGPSDICKLHAVDTEGYVRGCARLPAVTAP